MRYHLTPVKMAMCWRRYREKRMLLHCYWECKLVQPLWKTVSRFLRKLKIELPYDTAIPFWGIQPEKTIIQKDTCTPIFLAALLTRPKTGKQSKCPLTDEWVKMWYLHTLEDYSVIKKKKKELSNAICSNMDATRDYHTK